MILNQFEQNDCNFQQLSQKEIDDRVIKLTNIKSLYNIQKMDDMYESFKINEKIPTKIFKTSAEVSFEVAKIIKATIEEKNLNGQKAVLGLATGSTPLEIYQFLIQMHKNEGLSFKNVITFNLDEYYPVSPDSIHSYHYFMHENLFNHIDIPKENINIPKGDIQYQDIEKFCQEYEQKIKNCGGIDLQILGIGQTGHIGFNEPQSSIESLTRLIYLDQITLLTASQDFFGIENVPKKAITMGIKTILNAKQIVLLAFSESKAHIIKQAVEGPQTDQIPASFLQNHPKALILLDFAASENLTRVKCPWTIKPIDKILSIDFDDQMTKKAVLWLSRTTKKPISKLVLEDYEKNGLFQLLEKNNNNVIQLNHKVLEQIRQTISIYPLGYDQQKILIFSPHPDDDVICMAGTMKKLINQGHNVYVAYQTSGNVGVFDHDAVRFSLFVKEFSQKFNLSSQQEIQNIQSRIQNYIQMKKPGQIDSQEILDVKGMIRKVEAIMAAMCCGVKEENIIFLDMPFYHTGSVKKKQLLEEDIILCKNLIEKIQPSYIFAAGDLSDPHGTHRTCLKAILLAIKDIKSKSFVSSAVGSPTDGKKRDPSKIDSFHTPNFNFHIYLYRGAWQEWEIDRVSLAVPLHPDEVYQKRMAVFKHQSQKDKALFPGLDQREFWQRSERRNRQTAEFYNLYGLQEYEAMEVFVNYEDIKSLIKL